MTEGAEPRTVRVALVDDSDAVRRLVRLHLDLDGRFTVVGQASDGFGAVELAATMQPDVLIIDRHMPNLTGVEALPRIRQLAPDTAVILYTSDADAGTYQAAIAAGAVDVVLKEAPGDELVSTLEDILLRHWTDEAANQRVRIGPVPSTAALAWIENALCIVEAVRAHPEVLDRPVDPAVFDAFHRFLQVWRDIAEATPEFLWVARADPAQVSDLLEAWAAIGRIPEPALNRIGCHRGGEPGRPFYRAVTAAILDAVQRWDATSSLAATLGAQWGNR